MWSKVYGHGLTQLGVVYMKWACSKSYERVILLDRHAFDPLRVGASLHFALSGQEVLLLDALPGHQSVGLFPLQLPDYRAGRTGTTSSFNVYLGRSCMMS